MAETQTAPQAGAETAVNTAGLEQKTSMTLKGGIPSSNAGEEFVRVDILGTVGKFGQLDRRTGFVPVAEGRSAEFIKAVAEGHLKLKLGSKTRNGVWNIAVIDPSIEGVEIPAGAAAGAEMLTHEA